MASGARAASPKSRKNTGKDVKSRKTETDSKVRRYDPAETRARVLEAAYLLFGTRGYAGTGTADIAAQADVSEGSIFYHFGSKRAVLVELGKMHGQKMIAAMQGDDALADINFQTSLNRCFDFCEVHNVWETAGDCLKDAGAKKINKQNPEAEPFFNAAKETIVDWTRAHLDAMMAKNGLSGGFNEVTANLIFAAVGEAMQQYFAPGSDDARKARIRVEAIRFCDAALGQPAEQAARS